MWVSDAHYSPSLAMAQSKRSSLTPPQNASTISNNMSLPTDQKTCHYLPQQAL
uniref:Uncharacterized protein n=1 Tax=Nelumbo nucifera TaxID=4432 RepID=A0A822Z5J1_NELNU|nr:TPA_asm: hypothetical protein HUJ06_008907 [Nelumbo nucifera]